MFVVEQGLWQGCVLAPRLFNIFFTAVLRVAEKRFTAGAVIMDSKVQLLREKEEGGKKEGRARAGRVDGQKKEEAAQTLWGMLYADDAGFVSRSSEGLGTMMTVIVTACAAFGLTVSEAKTETCARKRKVGGTCRSPLLRPVRCTNGRVCVLGRGYQRRLGPQKCRGNASNPEGMGVLRTE